MHKVRLIFTVLAILLYTNPIYGSESGMVLIPAGDFNIGESTKAIHLNELK
jgi:uncharacterized protein HemY